MALHVKDAAAWKPVKDLWIKRSGVWTPVRRGFVRNGGVWKQFFQDETVVTLGNSSGVVLKNLFSTAEWADPLIRKRVVVPAGVEISAINGSYAMAATITADGQAGSWAGDLILDNFGAISGIGGTPNSGVGGNALLGNLPGRDGQKLIVNNYGVLRGGGGGGGLGGNGGPGWYHDYQNSGWLYSMYSYHWEENMGRQIQGIYWAGSAITGYFGVGATSYDLGGWRYFKGTYAGSSGDWGYYTVSRQLITPNTIYTSGGGPGSGGRGQGSDGANQSGAGGGGAGVNAGPGGAGGTGGGWGATGGTGNPGANGNNGSGTAGAAGGLPGGYLSGSGNIQLNNSGTLQGRLL